MNRSVLRGLERKTRWLFPLEKTGGRVYAWNDGMIEFRAPGETYFFNLKVRDALWAASGVEAWDVVIDIAFRSLPKRFKACRPPRSMRSARST